MFVFYTLQMKYAQRYEVTSLELYLVRLYFWYYPFTYLIILAAGSRVFL